MPTKTWPKLPDPPFEYPSGTYVDNDSPVPDSTSCKHGKGPCETCGTTNKRDTLHKTGGGKGAVGRLFKRKS
jgi:hypothetical protein